MNKVLVIPDVHGRDFWREPVNKAIKDGIKIIFLGDYTDPYPNEWPEDIDYQEKAYNTLLEIIDLKKQHPKQITLLLGNHDLSYLDYTSGCRTDRSRFNLIKDTIESNIDLFKLADEERIGGVHYIFSHAGITQQYAKLCFGDIVNENNVVDLFNNAWETSNYGILGSLDMYDYYRGWQGNAYASLVWADVREWASDGREGYGYQVFGHSALAKPWIKDKYADLDCSKAFIIDETGINEWI